MELGVCYYPEHWDEARWSVDAPLLREAGLSIVRMAEFAWSRLEPRESEFEFGWLDRAIELFARQGFRIVLGTPTAAPPARLVSAHPEMLPVDDRGRRRNFGGRHHYCPNSAVFRAATTRIVRAMAQHYAADARVVGWQIDNEFGWGNTTRCYCDNCRAAFRRWLERKYQTVAVLNEAWGTVFWSQEYDAWDQIGPPLLVVGDSPNPAHALDYCRFSSDSIAGYQQLQIDILRAAQAQPGAGTRQFVTTNFMGLFADLDAYELAKPLDLATWDSYPTGNANSWHAYLEDADDGVYARDVGNPYLTGMAHDLTRGLKDGLPFWIMEQQAGFVNWGEYNPAPRPGVMGLWLWHNFSAGVAATLFFRERAALVGQEQYHSGLMNHDGSPAQGYFQLQQFQTELALMRSFDDTRVTNEVALLVSYEDLWAIQLQPHLKGFSYWNVLFTWYAALLRAGVTCDIISERADLSRYKLVVAPLLHIADPSLSEHLKQYVEDGGLLVMGVRSGFKTPTNAVTSEPLPGALRDLVGAAVTSWQSVPPGVSHPVILTWRGATIEAARWVETLEPETATPIAAYTAFPLQGKAAMTVNAVGNGRVMYVGWLPDEAQANTLVGMLLPEAGVEPAGILPRGVIAGRRERDGKTFLFLMNFTDQPQRVWLNVTGWRDAAAGGELPGEVNLDARSVRVVARTPGGAESNFPGLVHRAISSA